ncbi:DUF1659 domain-containing protein [Oceanobacillus piezotolerans]|uniref:DUF1659 domain-containing protein n=1 Tax=Oceanobacillus piezotolerans TaxID=2448030 RepID=A0A498DB20_9BACI|nr:DUF1659 domain-containing protein [Oceanobacillus piezotolerans]RLL46778.1 DUF1659 domain-containing protein [Oceanobacillus piezotolerans]
MAVANITNTTLRLMFEDGTDLETGELVFAYKSFNNVKTTATADQLLATATAIASLQECPLYNIIRKDDSDIVEA